MASAIDDDTLAAVRAKWLADADLPGLMDRPPATGRLKSPIPLPYAHLASEPLRRESTGTGGAWFDWRKVTITVWGTYEQARTALDKVLAVFHQNVVLTFPSGETFMRWWPLDGGKLEQDPDVKEGHDVWKAVATGEVWSTRAR